MSEHINVSATPVKVTRVETALPPVDRGYSRVELVLDGREFEMSGPDAQILGTMLARAGGAPL